MGPIFLLLSLALSLFLILRDYRASPRLLSGFWVPFVWFLIIISRDPNYWFPSESGAELTATAYEDGNSFNRNIFLALVFFGIVVLVRRHVDWRDIIRRNAWLVAFAAFCSLSVLWSDYPMVALKTLIKMIIGNIVMALIIVTNPNPFEAIKRLFRWSIFLLVPLSVVLSKFFPVFGRTYHIHSGAGAYRGVTMSGNQLSTLCYLLGFFVVWELFRKGVLSKKFDLVVNLGMMVTMGWLSIWGDGATAILSFAISTGIFLLLRWNLHRPVTFVSRHMGIALCIISPLLVFGYSWFLDTASTWLGHSETLWGRYELWTNILKLGGGGLLGTGIGSYWLGSRLTTLWDIYWWRPTQAHNGYVENYVTLGYLGLILLGAAIASMGRRAARSDWKPGLRDFKLSYFFSALAFNLTEAGFRGLHPVWFLFLLFGLDTAEQTERNPAQPSVPAKAVVSPVRSGALVRSGIPALHPAAPRLRHLPLGPEGGVRSMRERSGSSIL